MLTFSTPHTPEELHKFIRVILGANLSRETRLAGHASHFDYICHAFFCDAFTTDADATRPQSNAPLDAVVLAPRGGGKTFLGALATTLDLIFKPGIQIRIIAGSEEQGARMLQYLRQFFLKPDLHPMIDGKPGKTIVELNNGSCVEVLAQSHASVRGIRVHKIKCDEVELFDPDIFAAVQLTTKSGTCGEFEVRGTVDCLSTQHLVGGLMQRMVNECEQGARKLFRWSLIDVLEHCDNRYACSSADAAGEEAGSSRMCPLLPECAGKAKVQQPQVCGHLTISDALRMKSRVDQDTWRAEMLCLKPGRSLAVYRDFDRAVHVVNQHPGNGEVVCGMDFGYRSPTAILWGVLERLPDGSDRLTVVDEYQQSQRTIQDHIAVLMRRAELASHALALRLSPRWIGADPAGHANTGASALGSHISQLRRAGFRVNTVRSDLGAGLHAVRARLMPAAGPPRLFVHARCTQLIEAIENYHYPPDRDGSEAPEKDGWDHLCDALRYMVVNLDKGDTKMGKYV